MNENDVSLNLSELFKLFAAHQWMGAVVIIIGLVIRLFKEDEALIPWSIPEKWRTWAALGLGAVLGVLKAIISGVSLQAAVLQGLLAAVTEIMGYHALVRPLSPSGELWTFKPKDSKGDSGAGPAALLLCLGLGMTQVSCGANLSNVLAQVSSAATQTSTVLALIEDAEKVFFAQHPAPKAQKEVETEIARVRVLMAAGLETAQGAQALDQRDVDAAFTDFSDAYAKLYKLLEDAGVPIDGAGKVAAVPGRSEIPKPMLVGLRVHK